MMENVVWAGTHQPSFAAAAEALKVLTGTSLSESQVRRITTFIGEDRVAERREQIAAFTNKTLMERTTAKPGVAPPEVGVLMLDNGMHQRRDHCVVITAANAAKRRTGNRRLAAWCCR